MLDVRVLDPIASADVVAITRLHDDVESADGHPSLNEAVWRDLEAPGPGSAGVLAADGETAVGYAHVARSDTFSPRHWILGLTVRADRREQGVEARLLELAVEHVARQGGGDAVLWIIGAPDATDAAVTSAGFRRQRDLLQIRVGLPLTETPAWPAGVTARAFVPDHDEEAWLEVNNRAFANHPEQSGWVRSTLQRRMREPWFDPAGFLLACDNRGVAGFCWTRVHPPGPDHDGKLGEIFVIGVDPSRQGGGLGRALCLAGLQSLAERGAREAMLFVDAANQPARRLYAGLGFRTHRLDRAYAREVAPA